MKVIIPCVDYSDYLKVTLPAWREKLKADFVIVTCHEDEKTKHVATDNNCRVLMTEEFHKGGKFNKAAALDLACNYLLDGEICLVLDADVYPAKSSMPDFDVRLDTIYGVKRYSLKSLKNFPDYSTEDLIYEPPANLQLIKYRGRGDSPWSCSGCFQMFRYTSNRRFGSFPTAALYDYEFAYKFPYGALIEFYVIHLGVRRENWEGRVTPEFELL